MLLTKRETSITGLQTWNLWSTKTRMDSSFLKRLGSHWNVVIRMVINIRVPRTRKIFSPRTKDEISVQFVASVRRFWNSTTRNGKESAIWKRVRNPQLEPKIKQSPGEERLEGNRCATAMCRVQLYPVSCCDLVEKCVPKICRGKRAATSALVKRRVYVTVVT